MVSSSMEKVSAALKSTDAKKQNLRKSFDSVKSYSSALATFTLEWSKLEQHFDSLQKSLEERFKVLEAKEKLLSPQPASSAFRSEMQSFCLKMDGVGLRSSIVNCRNDLTSKLEDFTYALQSAPDPAKLVVDALQGFYPLRSKKGKPGGELGVIRRTCVLMLDGLAELDPEIKSEVKENAKKLAHDWKQNVSTENEDQLEALAFLQLLSIYGLASEFKTDELLDLLVSIARRRQAIDLFKGLGFKDKLPEFIKKLSHTGKQIDAIKFIYEFEMVEKFPPVPLLKAFLQESKKSVEEVRKKGNYSKQALNEAISKETSHLKSMIKIIEEHNLQSQYSTLSLEKRVEQLEKQRSEKKRTATAPSSKSQQNQTQSGNKRPRMSVSNSADVSMHIGAQKNAQIHLQPMGLLRDQVPPYLSGPTHYGLSGNNPSYSAYMSSSAGVSGAGGVSANQGSSLSHLYSNSQLQSMPYDRPTSYGGHGLLPPYRSSFYS